MQENADLKYKDVLRNLGTALKVTSGILKAIQEIVKFIGFPFPDIAAILDTSSDIATKSENIQHNVQHVVDFGKSQAKNSSIIVDRSNKAPQRLEGNALGDVEALFGRNLVRKVTLTF